MNIFIDFIKKNLPIMYMSLEKAPNKTRINSSYVRLLSLLHVPSG